MTKTTIKMMMIIANKTIVAAQTSKTMINIMIFVTIIATNNNQVTIITMTTIIAGRIALR